MNQYHEIDPDQAFPRAALRHFPSVPATAIPANPRYRGPRFDMKSPLQPFLAGHGDLLGQLERRATEVMTLTSKVKQALPEPERHHVIAAVYHDDTLVITADSAVWTAQIRFAIDDLRKLLVESGEKTFVHLKVRVGRE
ncbi:MAG: DciA family protein [Steroidobacter sp.]|jgi:hypothetical protein